MFPGTPSVYSHQYATPHYTAPSSNKPKVGLAVVCRCCHGNTAVQCLLQKRGSNSCSPNKWSFPGGRLDKPGDLDDDGAVGTRRELEEECGGGAPLGLPSLIHIECCKSGKMRQTLYHVFVVDTSTENKWEKWQPKPKADKPTEVDLASSDLIIRGQTFTCVDGYCWVDMSVLIEECYNLSSSDESDLQHGLVRWVHNYGEHILKILIARSPKIPTRRLSNPPTPPNGLASTTTTAAAATTRPKGPKSDTPFGGGKMRRFPPPGSRTTFLQPPFVSIPPAIQPGAPQSTFYPITPPQQHSTGQLSPTGTTPIPPGVSLNSLGGGVENPPGMMLPVHHPSVMFFHPANHFQPPSNENHLAQQQQLPLLHPAPTGLVQHVPGGLIQHHAGGGILQQQPSTESLGGQSFPLSSSPTPFVTEVTEGVTLLSSHKPQRSGLVSEVSPTPVIVQSAQTMPLVGASPQGAAAIEPRPHHPLGVLPPGLITTAMPLTNQEQALLPTVTPVAQLPPVPGDKLGVAGALPIPVQPVRAADSGPLLPNPPAPILGAPPTQIPPHPAQTHQQNLRKETLCKHYLSGTGLCPFGDKCWFAHPDPVGSTPTPPLSQRYRDKAPTTTAYGPTQQTLPGPTPGGAQNLQWMNTQQSLVMTGVPQFVMASPPQSPIGSGVVTVPSAHLGALPPPRPAIPLLPGQQQQPLLLVRPQRPEVPFPGSTFPMMVNQPYPEIVMPQNPILRFDLLSDIRIKDNNGYPVLKISQQVSRADQLYLSFGPYVHNYKILFGGNRPCTQSFYLVEEKNLSDLVSCIHCSRQQPGLLVIGTETGSICMWDAKRGNAGHGIVVDVHRNMHHSQSLPKQSEEAICSLVHFATSINSAVVVGGTRGGVLSWYISQPPQKTFSLLFSDRKHHSQHSIIALQLLGGHLVSGDTSGRVVLWSMQSQSPFIQTTFYAHSLSLCNLHVVDSTHFLTVGTGPISAEDTSLVTKGTPSGGHFEGARGSLEGLTSEISQLTIANTTPAVLSATTNTGTTSSHDNSKYTINLWQFGTPPKLVSTWSEEGIVNCSSFHCHLPPGNTFLAVGLRDGTVKIFNLPNLRVASELHFPEMKGVECSHITINHSREVPLLHANFYRNPFRDLILTTAWSDGRVMVCQVAKQ